MTKRPANVFKKRNYNYASANPILMPLVEEGRVNLSFRIRIATYGPNFFLLKNLEINLMSDKLLKFFKDDLINL